MTALSPATLAVDALAAYRITRLVTADVVTQPLRERVIAAAYRAAAPDAEPLAFGSDAWQMTVGLDDDPPKLATLVTCRWCAGVWVAAGVVAARRLAPEWWAPIADAMACAAAAALVAGLES